MITLMITFIRVESMSYLVRLGIPSSFCKKGMVNCVWRLIIEFLTHRLCLKGIFFPVLMIF